MPKAKKKARKLTIKKIPKAVQEAYTAPAVPEEIRMLVEVLKPGVVIEVPEPVEPGVWDKIYGWFVGE